MLPHGDGYGFSIPRGYAPVVISNDCYPRQEGVRFNGWGDTEVATWWVLVKALCKSCPFSRWTLSPALLLEKRGPQ